jgi:putative phosphoesterase
MKVCVMSDSHGNRDAVAGILKRERPDVAIHAGDFAIDLLELSREQAPINRAIAVSGNCDLPGAADWDQLIAVGSFRLFLTHGHRYQVKQGYLNLVLKGQEVGADLVVFGHTHTSALFIEAGKLFLNPGSVSQPRGYKTPTYVVMEWQESSADPNVTLTVRYCSAYDGSVCEDLTHSIQWDGTGFSFA